MSSGRAPRRCVARPARRGLPGRIVARVRRDVPLALLDAHRGRARVPHPAGAALPRIGAVGELALLPLPASADRDRSTSPATTCSGSTGRCGATRACRRREACSWPGLASLVGVLGLDVLVGHGNRPIPLSVVVLGSAVTIMFSGAIRFQSRLFAFRRRAFADVERTRVLVMGAGEAGAQVLNDILRHPEIGLDVVGMVDDDPRHVAHTLHGVRCWGDVRRSPIWCASSASNRCCWRSRARRAI